MSPILRGNHRRSKHTADHPVGRARTRTARVSRATVGALGAFLLLFGLLFGGMQAPTSAGAVSSPPPKTSGGANTDFQFSVEPYSAPGSQQRSYVSYQLQPGHNLLDQVVVLNKSSASESFLVYPEDATVVPGTGGFGFQSRGKMHNTAVGVWATVGNTSLTVPAGKEVVVTFELAVPADAPSGDHVGAVVVEELHTPAQQQQRVGLNTVLRIAVPMYVHVVGPTHPSLTIERVDVVHRSPIIPYLQSATTAVQIKLVNTGDDIVDPKSVAISITGLIGGTIHSYTVHQTGAAQSKANPLPIQMLPGAKLTLTEVWSNVPPFDPLTVHVTAQGIDPTTGLTVSNSASARFWYFPWILVILVVALIVLFVWWRRRRARDKRTKGTGNGSTPRSGDPLPGRQGTQPLKVDA